MSHGIYINALVQSELFWLNILVLSMCPVPYALIMFRNFGIWFYQTHSFDIYTSFFINIYNAET